MSHAARFVQFHLHLQVAKFYSPPQILSSTFTLTPTLTPTAFSPLYVRNCIAFFHSLSLASTNGDAESAYFVRIYHHGQFDTISPPVALWEEVII
jgi:hypothetical protein